MNANDVRTSNVRKLLQPLAVWSVAVCLLAAVGGLVPSAVGQSLTNPVVVSQRFDEVDLTVVVQTPDVNGTTFGYAEYRVTVLNRGERSRRVRLTLPARSWGTSYGGSYISSLTRTLEVPAAAGGAGSARTVSMFQPPVPMTGDDVAVEVDGQAMKPTLRMNMGTHADNDYARAHSGVNGGGDQALRSPGVNRATAGANVSPMGPTDQWSTSWLGYSRFAVVQVTLEEWRTIPSDVREAVLAYVEAGGALMVSGDTSEVAAEFKPLRAAEPSSGGATINRGGNDTFRLGLGSISMGGSPDGFMKTPAAFGLTPPGAQRGRVGDWNLQNLNAVYPVVDNLGVPARGMLVLMIVFAVLIGPINLYFLAKYDRRIWALWTVPAAALVCSTIVFSYALFSEGLSGRARHAGLTVLDEHTGRATTLGWSAYYTPVAPGGGLVFSSRTEVTPLGLDIGDRYGYGRTSSTALSIDWTDGQRLGSGWVQSRVPAFFATRKVEDRLERMVFAVGAGGVPTVQNGLGAAVSSVRIADAEGKVYQARDVEAGATAAMTPVGALPSDVVRNQSLLDVWVQQGAWYALDAVAEPIGPSTYIATLEGSAPFLDKGLDTAVSDERQVVIGLMREPLRP